MDFGSQLIKFRKSNNLTQVQLAELLGVGKVTIIRWENNSSKPSKLAADQLEKIGFGAVDINFTKYKSIPRLVIHGSENSILLENIRNKIKIGNHETSLVPAPYVINGPEDQLNFFETLFKLQEQQNIGEGKKYLRRLSLIATLPEYNVTTAQNDLEQPKKNAKHWSPNYGTHGWHRYVGRFPSHLVRALINHFNVKPDEVILDPFAGSGTTLVESRLMGYNAIGVEICPLSALISRAKSKFPSSTSALELLIESLSNFYNERWNIFVQNRQVNSISHEEILSRPGCNIVKFANYEKWLTPEALLGISIVVEFAETLKGYEQDFICCALSSCMRSIGNVDVDVIRAEYSKNPRENVDVLRLVNRALAKMIRDINASQGSHKDLISDANTIKVIKDNILKASIKKNSINYIITSPPYGVESLSYIRTHLLSYRTLDPILKYDPYAFNEGIIGSEFIKNDKEINNKWETAKYSKTFVNFFENEFKSDGSRKMTHRKHMMMQFFDDMTTLAKLFSEWLRIGGRVAFVVGNKRLGDYVIPTDVIIAEVFKAQKLQLDQVINQKLKFNNSNSEVPWQERIIQNEFVMIFTKN